MTNRENTLAILRYEPYERLPLVSFGYWSETVEKWAAQGHITHEEAEDYDRHGDNGWGDRQIMARLGFDYNWNSCVGAHVLLDPPFEETLLRRDPDGSRVIRDSKGLICRVKPGITSIPSMIGTALTDRTVWEQEYLPRLQMHAGRLSAEQAKELPDPRERQVPIGLHLGSLMGHMRDLLGVEQLSYLYADDEDLYREIVDTLCGLCYSCAEGMLQTGTQFDYAHYWEDICFKHGPLVVPGLRRAGGPLVPEDLAFGGLLRHRHHLPGLRRHDRLPDPHLAPQRRQYHVPHRGRHLGRQHRPLAGEVRQRAPGRGRHGQAGLRPG